MGRESSFQIFREITHEKVLLYNYSVVESNVTIKRGFFHDPH